MTSEQNRSQLPPNQDPSSVYYIHPSDHTSQQLVSVKFDGAGYSSWKRCMLIAISAKNKVDFVTGKIPKPPSTDPKYSTWIRCNDMIMSWIIYNLDAKLVPQVMYFETAADIWKDLEDQFGYTSFAKLFSLEKQLGDINQGNSSVIEFYSKIKVLWDELNIVDPLVTCICQLCTCNVTKRAFQQQQNRRLIHFMMKLSEQFATIRGNILMMPEMPPITQAYRLFAQEETHKQLTQAQSDHHESIAFAASHHKYYNNTNRFPEPANTSSAGSYNAADRFSKPTNATGSYGTSGNNYSSGNKRSASYYFCSHCKIHGHSLERCFKIHGYPPGFTGFKDKKVAATTHLVHNEESPAPTAVNKDQPPLSSTLSTEQYSYLVDRLNKQVPPSPDQADPEIIHQANLAGTFCLASSFKIAWIIDSGATDHICNNLNFFCSYHSLNGTDDIIIPDGKKIKVTHIGTV